MENYVISKSEQEGHFDFDANRKDCWEKFRVYRLTSVLGHLEKDYKSIYEKHHKLNGDELFFRVRLEWLGILTKVGVEEETKDNKDDIYAILQTLGYH
jgi:hypothetical protein